VAKKTPTPNEQQLALITRASHALAEANTIEEVILIKNQGEAAIKFAKSRRDIGNDAILAAQDIVRRSERVLGKWLKAMDKARGGNPRKVSTGATTAPVKTLADYDINKRQSARWQQEAEVPKKVFEKWVKETKEADGELTQTGLIREYTKHKREQQIAANKELGDVEAPDGEYGVIVIDPPWPMEKIERDCAPEQTSVIDYPTMTEDELAVMELPTADDCHLFLWTTHKFLPMALRLLPRWDFRYVCTMVWHKPGGFQPVGLPQYNCEFCLYARYGTPTFIDTKAFPVCFSAPRGKHSEKPQEFYEIIKRVTAGPRIDMFNRRPIDGFKSWGNEAAQ